MEIYYKLIRDSLDVVGCSQQITQKHTQQQQKT